jgi:hypothetical protein
VQVIHGRRYAFQRRSLRAAPDENEIVLWNGQLLLGSAKVSAFKARRLTGGVDFRLPADRLTGVGQGDRAEAARLAAQAVLERLKWIALEAIGLAAQARRVLADIQALASGDVYGETYRDGLQYGKGVYD